jgi:undecaprenyl phosphate N,N'-diacetylbacillosamine 1-phosphate transferase
MYRNFFKRMLDFIGALILSPFVCIVICLAAPFIYFEDHGNIFYNAERVGRGGKPFRMYKLRSMYVNAPDLRLADGSTYNGEDDPRVTKVGRLIRKTSIDELPQVFNVLKGEMSFVGPRPDPMDWLDRYPAEYRGFLAVAPGITGYSQAYFRNSVDGEQKMKNDLYYAQNLTFVLDIKIIFQTIAVVLKHENLYKDEDIDHEGTDSE